MRGKAVPIGTQIRLPNGYFNQKTVDGWRLAHYIVIEEHLGRPVEFNERVYFKNKTADKAHPKPEDLEVRTIKPPKVRSGRRTKKDLLVHNRQLEDRLADLEARLDRLEQ